MSAWAVGDFHFEVDANRLRSGRSEVILEPKASALLAYFCEHAGRTIDRDELLAAVWHGQIVADNSISRVVALLRKALGDDDKVRRYIATVPKVGYRLIAEVRVMDGPAPAPAVSTGRPTRRWGLPVAAFGLVAVAVVALAPKPQPISQLRSIAPLSRLAVTQSNAALAGDGRTLLYTASDGEHTRIYLSAGPNADPVAISQAGGDADFATWAHDDRFIVYQYLDGEVCEFHRLSREQFSAPVAEVIYDCVPGSYSELSLSLDDQTLYFLERPTSAAPYAAYALDLVQRRKRRLSQPVSRGYGNHYLDVHPQRGTLLLLSDHAPGKTTVFELDPSDDSFDLLRTFDYGLDSAIWSHREGFIVHPSMHPSYQLLETSVAGEESAVIVSDSRRIASPRRLAPAATGGEYLFTSYLYNRDIRTDQASGASINSAVMDYLPAMSQDGQRLAFVSKRAGYSQVWIKDFATGQLRAVEAPDRGRRFHDLSWSQDDRELLASTSTGVLVYSLEKGGYRYDVKFELPAFAVRWAGPQTLALSHYENGRWQAYHHRLDTGARTALDPRWAFSIPTDGATIYLDQTLQAYRDGELLAGLQGCASPVWRYQLRWHVDGESLYCHAADAPADLIRIDASMTSQRLAEVVARFEFFSVRDGLIASTHVASSYSDIMRTQTAR